MIVDAHQHFWKLDRGDYDWLSPDLGVLYRDYLPEDLAPVLDRHGVSGTILVQAAPTEAETRFMLEIAKSSATVLGVVGWIDMEADDATDRLDQLVADGEGYIKGIRPMVQDIPDPDWILQPKLDRVFDAIEAHGLVFEALIKPLHANRVEARIRRHSGLLSIINHAAKPDIAGGGGASWREAMLSLSDHTNTVCKLSGLVTEASQHWEANDILPYIDELIDLFGPERLIWGSDWPVVNLASDYGAWFEFAQNACSRLTEHERKSVFGLNALSVYGLEGLCSS